jgi:glycerol-3-phosphate dehydrogenase subunit C
MTAENIIIKIFEKCAGDAGCEVCRPHMEDDCLFFPELYRLHDQASTSELSFSPGEITSLLDLCTLCGLCPCKDVRMLILEAKTAIAAESRVSISSRIICDVKTLGRLGTSFPKIANAAVGLTSVLPILKKTMNIHPERDLPFFPEESFFRHAKKNGITSSTRYKNEEKPGNETNNKTKDRAKVAYFAGCSAGYMFPGVGKAAVKILEQNNIQVFVPPQECCGMPLILEGQKKKALKKIKANIENLFTCIENGYDIVCSCPTCGYFFKKMLLDNAYYSDAFQDTCGAGPNFMKVPTGSRQDRFTLLPKQAYKKILKDDGFFSSIDPLKRIELSKKVKDLGEYLLDISGKANGNDQFKVSNVENRSMIYYAPCHQREQEIGQPYYHLLNSIPGSDIIQTNDAMHCCGMGGHLGYKTCFHPHALKTGQPLFEKLLSEKNRVIVTDCLSCKMQFQQTLPMDVFHPLELL